MFFCDNGAIAQKNVVSSLDQLLILARTGDLKKIPTCLVGEHLAGCYHAIYVYSLRTYLIRIFERRAAIISGVCYRTLTEVATAFLWVLYGLIEPSQNY